MPSLAQWATQLKLVIPYFFGNCQTEKKRNPKREKGSEIAGGKIGEGDSPGVFESQQTIAAALARLRVAGS
jgi:hypothetical protein